jgi:hypothetical protein
MIWNSPYINKQLANINYDSIYKVNGFPLLSLEKQSNTYAGKDHRYNETEPEFDSTIYKKYSLLKTLESGESTFNKMELLNNNHYLFNYTAMSNIIAGGLYDDYNFDFF